MFDTYWNVEPIPENFHLIKASIRIYAYNGKLNNYWPGCKPPLPDGIWYAEKGFVIVKDGIVIMVTKEVRNGNTGCSLLTYELSKELVR